MRSYCVKYTLGGQKIIDIRLQFAWKKYIESILSVYGKIDKGILFITYAGLTNAYEDGTISSLAEQYGIENAVLN